MKPRAVIFDIDGTLAKMGDRSPFDWKKVGVDTPHQDIIDLAQFFHNYAWAVVVVTGRLETCREETIAWLEKYGVPYEDLFMRRKDEEFEKDFKIKTRIFKEEIEPKYQVAYVFDDRDQTVKGWRTLGLRTLQVAPGNF